jgi:8-hydroxy-5-deazaflavin:NADPH oxidoreductase
VAISIGILGAGGIGKGFAKQVARAGYEVWISNSRGPDSLKETVTDIGGNTKAVTAQEAINADVVFLSILWHHAEEIIRSLTFPKDAIVIDAMNPILPGYKFADLHGKTSSEIVQELLPSAHVVKAFNTLSSAILASDPSVNGGKRVIFYCGNDEAAKKTVGDIINTSGFAAVDLGILKEGSRIQQFPGGTLSGLNLIQFE